MKKKNYFSLLFVFALLLVGCKDNDDVKESDVVAMPNSSSFQNLRKAALAELTQTKEFEVDGNGNIEFTSKKGVKVSIPEYCLTVNGGTMSGTVKLEFIEHFDKSTLLTTNIATMGRDSNGDVKFLVTGGAFYLKLTHNGKEVESPTYCNYELEVPAKLTGKLDNTMKLWYGNFNEEGNLIWEEVITENWNPETGEGWNPETGEGWNPEVPMPGLMFQDEKYLVIANKFGWVNIDRFYDNELREVTPVTVKVPSEYDGKNSAVYMSYKEVPGLATIYYHIDKKIFTTGNYTLPIGLEVHVIFASESNGKWAYAIKSAKITKDHQVEFLKSDLKEATQAEFEAAIEAIK